MDNYKNGKFKLSQELDTKEIEHLIFDSNDKYIVAYGNTRIWALDLENKKEKLHWEINKSYFEKIYHLRFSS
jgi:hypothetical protein